MYRSHSNSEPKKESTMLHKEERHKDLVENTKQKRLSKMQTEKSSRLPETSAALENTMMVGASRSKADQNGSTNGNNMMMTVGKEEEWNISQHHPHSSSSSRFSTRNIADWLYARQETTGLSMATRRLWCNPMIQPQHLASSVAWYVQYKWVE